LATGTARYLMPPGRRSRGPHRRCRPGL